MSQNNQPWVEKYRPNNFKDIVLDKINSKILTNIIEKQYFPNLGLGWRSVFSMVSRWSSNYF